jgi:hypothetical protein
MASTIEMRRQDMIELYQLLGVYIRTYQNKRDMTEMIMEEIEERYKKIYNGQITEEKNPRNAGRKSRHTLEEDRIISEYRSDGLSYREIASKCGCTLSRVQGVLKGQVYRN